MWPRTRKQPEAVKIQFQAGHGGAESDVPPRIRRGILLYAADMWNNRDVMSGVEIQSSEIDALLADYQVKWWS